MKNIHSIKIYKLLLDISWYMAIVVLSIWAIVNIFSVGFDGVIRGSDAFTFGVETKSLNDNPFKFSDSFNFSVEKKSTMDLTLDNFKVSQLGTPFILVFVFSYLIAFSLGMWQVKLLRDFLGNIIEKKIFISENVAKLTHIALIELSTIPLTIIYYLVMSAVFEKTHVLNPGFIFVTDYVGSFESIIRALEYFVFAGVFSFGLKLKQEQDLTI